MLTDFGFRHPLRCDRGLRCSAMLRVRMLVHFGTKVKRSNKLTLEFGTDVVSRNVWKPTTSLRRAALQKTKPHPHPLRCFSYAFLCTERTLNVHLCVLCARARICFMYVFVCVCVCIYVHTHTHTHTHTCARLCCMYVCVYIYVLIYLYIHIRARMCFMYVYVYIYVLTHTHTHTHTHIYIHARAHSCASTV